LDLLYGSEYDAYTEENSYNFEIYNPGRTPLERWKNQVKRDVFSLYRGYPSTEPISWMRRLSARLFSGRILGLYYRLPKWKTGRRVLELGCSFGYFMKVLKEFGWEPTGLEWSPEFAREVSRKTGFPVLENPESLLKIPDASYDAVVLWNVLEHVTDAVWILRQIHRILKPGGEVKLTVPNTHSLAAMALKPYWAGISDPRHFFHFTAATLDATASKAGWTSFRIRTLPMRSGWLTGLRYRLQLLGKPAPEPAWFEREPMRRFFIALAVAGTWIGRGDFLFMTGEKV